MPSNPQHFLDVAHSASGRSWRARLGDDRMALAISSRCGLPEILGRVLAARGVDEDSVEQYLDPTLKALMPDPDVLRDMDQGCRRVADAIMASEKVGIIGDYDVDGVSSTAVMIGFLQAAGLSPEVHIPERIGEGYGPSRQAVAALKETGVQLLITLDCGVSAHDPLGHAAELGLETVVVDHHQASERLPTAHAVINPNRQDDVSGLGYLCAAGVTFLLLAAVNRQLRSAGWWNEERPEPDLLQWLALVALATVCDVVPLVGLNRALVTQGLKVMARRSNPGLAALADTARLRRRPDPHALGFVLGPRLNAAGRLGSAMLALRLLTTQERGEAVQIAAHLEKLNQQRQALELRIVEDASRQAEASLGAERSLPAIVVSGENWHPGVLGLVASRLKERFELPSIALGFAGDEAVAAGSGRSIPGVDLGRAVLAAVDAGVIIKGGGHAMAAGLSVARENLAELRKFLSEALAEAPQISAANRFLAVDGALSAGGASLDLVQLLERAGPYGSGNPAPVFAFPAHRVVYADSAGADHVRCTLAGTDGTRLKAISFRTLGTPLGELLLRERSKPLHVAGRINIDDWGGKRQVQLMIDDVAQVA